MERGWRSLTTEEEREREKKRVIEREKGGRMRNDIYRRRQSLVSVSSGGSEAHLSVFSNQHCASNLLSFARSFPPSLLLSLPPSLSPSLRLGYCLPAGQVRRESASAAASSVPALHTDCVYWVNTKCFTVGALVLLSLWGPRVGFYHNVYFHKTNSDNICAAIYMILYIFWKFNWETIKIKTTECLFLANLVHEILKKRRYFITLMQQTTSEHNSVAKSLTFDKFVSSESI